jgi:ethanolamine ammonia-lyase large subunit
MNIMDEKGNVQPVTQAHHLLQNMPKHLLSTS